MVESIHDNSLLGVKFVQCNENVITGRGGNIWLSPEGCAMFSLQLHIPLKSELGRLLPFLQHTVSVALVNSICSQPGLEVLYIWCFLFNKHIMNLCNMFEYKQELLIV